MKRIILFLGAFFSCLPFIYSQPGRLDSSFGNYGIVTANLGASYNYHFSAKKVLEHTGGGIYIIAEAYISKRLQNGLPDSVYAKNSFSAFSPINIRNAALQQDGKIVAVGSDHSNFSIVRYNTNGSLDKTFGNDGKQNTYFGANSVAQAVAIQKDGKIVVGGYFIQDVGRFGDQFSFVVTRYNVNGSLDDSFANNGIESAGFPAGVNSIAIQRDGKIVVTASDADGRTTGIARLDTKGNLDTAFTGGGWFETDFVQGEAVAIEVDGKIVVVGSGKHGYYGNNIVASYNPNGTVDSAFGEDGIQLNSFKIASLAVQPDGKIVIAGDSSLARFTRHGSLDSSFSADGLQQNDFAIASVTFDRAGKIVVTGAGYARYNPDGSPDNTFNKAEKLPLPFEPGNTAYTKIQAQTDGKIIVAGSTWSGSAFENILARYNRDGTLDSTFSEDGIQVTKFAVTSLAVQNDGRVVVAAGFPLARYNRDGSIDSSFGKDGMQVNDFAIEAMASQSDGKIVVVGSSSVKDDSGVEYPGFGVNRYNTSGKLDSSFSEDGKVTTLFFEYNTDEGTTSTIPSSAYLIAVQADGKIVVAGSANGSNKRGDDIERGEIVRYDTDGNRDSTFIGKISSYDGIEYRDHPVSMAVGSSGKIVVVSIMNSRDYNDAYLTSLDPADGFTISLPYLSFRNSIVAVQGDGKIIIRGEGLSRLNADGTSDTTFKANFAATAGSVNDIVIDNNKLYTAGASNNFGNVGVVARFLLDNKNESTPPNVTLTAPANNTTYLSPAAHIKLTATASASDGTISKVEFYNGTHLLHTEYIVPYGFVWRNVPVGNYTLTAKAYDNSGFVTTSSPVHISVVPNKPPVVSIINPQNNQSFAAPADIQVEANTKDTDGRMARVEFYNGSILLNTQFQLPYRFVWKNVSAGAYTITAVAIDNWGARTKSAPVTIRVTSQGAMIVSNKRSSADSKSDVSTVEIVSLAPNPANDIVTIYTTGLPQDKETKISVISSLGVVMKTMQLNSSAKTIQLNVSSLAKGVYTVKLISGDKVSHKQFVKL